MKNQSHSDQFPQSPAHLPPAYNTCNEQIPNTFRDDNCTISPAYSNKHKRQSVIVVSKTTDIWEFFNSFAHEVDHIEKHIAKTLGFSPYSESASYLVGELVRNMFYNIFKKYYARIN